MATSQPHITRFRPLRLARWFGAALDGVLTVRLSVLLLKDSGYSKRGENLVIRVYDESGNAIETHEHAGDFKEP
jgi:hypothetical protein